MKTLLLTTLAFLVFSSTISGQERQQKEVTQRTDQVVRIGTDLFQTDVMVFDRQGHFVDGLKREQFELRVDGKPQQISFFDIVAAGSSDEESRLAAARGETKKPGDRIALRPEGIGRTIFFFVDDLHLSADSVMSTRKLLLRWIDDEMGIKDRVGIIAASGAVGFLQQLSDNKAVLRAAVARLSFRNSQVEDIERPAMNEFQALAIEKNDPNMVAYFLEATVRENPMFTGRAVNREAVESHFRRRAASVARQSAGIATRMLSTLQSLLRSSGQLTGSKLVFFISDGFLLQTTVSDALENLRRITDAAARAGIVIYTVDARGLVVGLPEARSGASADRTGAQTRASGGHVFDSQDGLNALAADTGGRAIRDTNGLDAAVRKALDETSQYYVLAWHSQPVKSDNASFRRIEVSITGRPDLTVRAKRGFYDGTNNRVTSLKKPGTKRRPAEELIDAVKSTYPGNALAATLDLGYLYSPQKGPLLAVSLRVEGDTLEGGKSDGQVRKEVDLFGLVLDDQGHTASTFKQTLPVSTASENRAHGSTDVGYRDVISLAPGLYQVRVAARDANGRTGGAHQWIEIPEFKAGRLALSSVFVWERTAADLTSNEQPAAAAPKMDRQFVSTSQLRFMIMIYNAAVPADGSAPEIEIQTRVLRDSKPIVSSPPRKVSTAGLKSLGQIPYGGEFSLEGMAAGVYIIEMTATDRTINLSAIQRCKFEIK